MEYFDFRSPWQQAAVQNAWDGSGPDGLPCLAGQSERPPDAPRGCHLWLPTWCDHFHWPFQRGVTVDDWNPRLFGVLSRKGAWLDMPFVLGELHLASARLQKVLNAVVPGLIQWLPFRLRDPYGRRIARRYAIANYLERKDVIDRKRSRLYEGRRWRVDSNGDFCLRALAISRKKIGDSRLFRIHGATDIVVIREDVRRELEKAGVTGCSFGGLLVT